MNRNQTIATVAATTGIFAATIVAGISIMQASASTETTSALPVLAAETATTSNLTFTPQPLPELPALPDNESSGTSVSSASEPQASAESVQNASAAAISQASARSIVAAASEGKVTGVEEVTRSGVSAFAVTLARSDGSVITGYVDTATGTIFDWVINKKAPAPTQTNNYDDDDDEDREDHDDDDYDDDEDDEDREDHEGDDDDD